MHIATKNAILTGALRLVGYECYGNLSSKSKNQSIDRVISYDECFSIGVSS